MVSPTIASTKPAPSANAWKMMWNASALNRRRKRLKAAFPFPNPDGKSRHGQPVRAIQGTAAPSNRGSGPARAPDRTPGQGRAERWRPIGRPAKWCGSSWPPSVGTLETGASRSGRPQTSAGAGKRAPQYERKSDHPFPSDVLSSPPAPTPIWHALWRRKRHQALVCKGFLTRQQRRRGKGERLDNDPSGARYGCFLPDLTGLARRLPAPTSRRVI